MNNFYNLLFLQNAYLQNLSINSSNIFNNFYYFRVPISYPLLISKKKQIEFFLIRKISYFLLIQKKIQYLKIKQKRTLKEIKINNNLS